MLAFINKKLKSLIFNFIIYALIFSFISCVKKEYIVSRPPLFKFQKLEIGKKYMIRVHKDDAKLYEGYIALLKRKIDFCNKQIDDYDKSIYNILEKTKKNGL